MTKQKRIARIHSRLMKLMADSTSEGYAKRQALRAQMEQEITA